LRFNIVGGIVNLYKGIETNMASNQYTASGIKAPQLSGSFGAKSMPFNMRPRASHPIYRKVKTGNESGCAINIGNNDALEITGFQI
jgi:hypothetical protein